MSVELPKDAEWREIPLDTEVLYDDNGVKVNVDEFKLCVLPSLRTSSWTIRGVFEDEEEQCNLLPHFLHLIQPDSWEKLEEDLDRCIEESDLCMYYNNQNPDCNKCTISGNESRGCTSIALEDIKKRISKLRGDGE